MFSVLSSLEFFSFNSLRVEVVVSTLRCVKNEIILKRYTCKMMRKLKKGEWNIKSSILQFCGFTIV